MTTGKRVLIVDDEPDLSELLAYNLERGGYVTRVEHDGVKAVEAARTFQPDLMILDVMMPELSGLEVADRVKRDPALAGVPIIMLTARSDERDELDGLSAGADDYVTKPFSMKVLEARIEAVLRRAEAAGGNAAAAAAPESAGQILRAGQLQLDRGTHEVRLGESELQLTNTEFRLLLSLMEAGGRVLSRQALISQAMGPGVTVTERTIDVHVTSIRKKLGDEANLIKTVRGVGYRMTSEVMRVGSA
ncbi:MAG: response regulator transcription factor [Planctomycetota bacterium]